MANWLNRLLGGANAATASGDLAARLATYPAYTPPHPGFGDQLSEADARANLDDLLTRRSERLAALGRLLAAYDIDLAAGLATPDPAAFLEALQRWTLATWPSVYDRDLARPQAWRETDRAGSEIVYSLLLDVGIALGEIVIARRPDYAWTLDLDPASRRDDMASWRRPVVRLASDPAIPTPIQFDFEEIAVNHYRQAGGGAMNLASPIGRGVLEALSGEHERHWRQGEGR